MLRSFQVEGRLLYPEFRDADRVMTGSIQG